MAPAGPHGEDGAHDMGMILGATAQLLVILVQALPLSWAARLGRCCGALAWHLDRRHRRVALANLHLALGKEYSPKALLDLARENFRRLGENYACAVKAAAMRSDELAARLEWRGVDRLPAGGGGLVVAAGHFGNFELFARARDKVPWCTVVTTYRELRPPALNRVLQRLRSASGARFFERTREGGLLRETLRGGNILLGLLADQHAGGKGLWLPFFGHECSTTAAPAVYALRYDLPLIVGVCYRTAPAHWCIEFGPGIPTHQPDGTPRTPGEIMGEVNQAFEAAIRRDPANWFWVHRRWKPPGPHQLRKDRSPSEP